MAAHIIDGKGIAAAIRLEITERTAQLPENKRPGLAVILVGSDPASISYVSAKEKALEAAGMRSEDVRLPESCSQKELLAVIHEMNQRKDIHGILVQLPLPKHIDSQAVIHSIHPFKDVDAFHPENLGLLLMGTPRFLPCTPHGIIRLLEKIECPVAGSRAVIVGRSNIVGKPLANMLLQRDCNATVTVCHTGTRNLAEHTSKADILIAAAGTPGLISPDMVKPGAVIIDVGVNRIPDESRKKGFRLSGDVDFEELSKTASWITPVPGGVGPMTITMLLENTLRSAIAASMSQDPVHVR
ncbi:bifunctional 5,10-methylenetetrahydrofolate dehydrogenase/5,10-methenyltetrahydrofolate cyclohydrolase [Spirochaeta dissipatitropha]